MSCKLIRNSRVPGLTFPKSLVWFPHLLRQSISLATDLWGMRSIPILEYPMFGSAKAGCVHIWKQRYFLKYFRQRKHWCIVRALSKLQRKLLGNDCSPFVLTGSMKVTQPFTAGASKDAGEWWEKRWKGKDKRSPSPSFLFIVVNHDNTQYQCLALGKAFVESSEGLKETQGWIWFLSKFTYCK